MSGKFGQQPTAVLSEESQQISGTDALSMNVAAGTAVADAVRTTLGPTGMDKMLVSQSGDVVVTNDGATVLAEMDVDHPVAEMVIDVARTQEAEVGDGTTTSAVVAGALLDEAEGLVDRGIHPSTIVSGYRQASDVVRAELDEMTVDVSPDDTEALERIARTALNGKCGDTAVDVLAPIVVRAVRRTVLDGTPEPDAIKVHPFSGSAIEDTRLVEGLLVDREPDHPNMSTSYDDVEILLYDGEIDVTETAADGTVDVGSMGDLEAFVEREREELAAVAEGIVQADVDVVFTSGSIEDSVQARLAEAGILSLAGLRDPDVEKLVRTTGAKPVTRLESLTEEDLGSAGRIRMELIRGAYGPKSAAPEKSLVISDVPDGSAATILIRGGTQHVVDEVERAVEDAIDVVAAVIESGRVLPGGGAPEAELARVLRRTADGVDGREQLAVEAAADALETIPRTLAENGGLDPVDALVDLRSSHDSGAVATGVDVNGGEVADMNDTDVVEPGLVKFQALTACFDAVVSILRIDDVVSAGDLSTGDDEEEDEQDGMTFY